MTRQLVMGMMERDIFPARRNRSEPGFIHCGILARPSATTKKWNHE
jgi:hypothetical protein